MSRLIWTCRRCGRAIRRNRVLYGGCYYHGRCEKKQRRADIRTHGAPRGRMGG